MKLQASYPNEALSWRFLGLKTRILGFQTSLLVVFTPAMYNNT
jgi:hypothetical protein